VRFPKGSTQANLVLSAVAIALAATALPASASPPSVADKKAQAQAILVQVQSLDSDLNRAAEAYNAASLDLSRTTQQLSDTQRQLRFARTTLTVAHRRAADRLVELYESDHTATTIEIVLGAASLDDALAALESADRIASQDAQIVSQVSGARTEIAARTKLLAKQRDRAAELVRERASRRNAIEGKLRERQQLLSSVQDEVRRLEAQERQRQLLIAQQVRERLARERANPQPAPAGATATPEPEPMPSPTASPGETSVPAVTAPPPPARYGGVVGIAMRYLGIPYKWGGASPSSGFDCSGFTMYVYAQIGVSLPHYTGAQWQMGSPVPRDQLQPGDLVFFDGLGHEGMYIGGNQFIHAPHTGDVVKISSISGWYAQTYMGARRL
jgi:cell wall-associated NlpC family hydrolase